MRTSGAFHLASGDTGPRQQSRVSCGAACLVVARMMIDADLTRWITHGASTSGRADPSTPADRFAQCERAVLRRTNSLRSHGRRQIPWPTMWGTPPWGALAELEHGASLAGTRYEIALLREAQGQRLRASLEHVMARTALGAPALLYLGSPVLPRHVVLLFCQEGGSVGLYDPSDGQCTPVPVGAIERGELRLSGWDTVWLTVHPRAQERRRGPVELPSWWPTRALPGFVAPGALARGWERSEG